MAHLCQLMKHPPYGNVLSAYFCWELVENNIGQLSHFRFLLHYLEDVFIYSFVSLQIQSLSWYCCSMAAVGLPLADPWEERGVQQAGCRQGNPTIESIAWASPQGFSTDICYMGPPNEYWDFPVGWGLLLLLNCSPKADGACEMLKIWSCSMLFFSLGRKCAQTNLVESSSGGSVHGAGIGLQASLEALNPARGGCTHTAFGTLLQAWGWVWLCWRHQPYSRNVVPEHCSTAFSSWQWDALCRTPSSYPGRMPMCMACVPWAACRYRVNRCAFSSLPKNFENLMSLICSVPSKIRCEYRETWLLELDNRVHLPSNIGPPRWSEGQ